MNNMVISDFSKTLTSSSNPTTWSVLALSGLLGEKYIQERTRLYEKNYHYEVEGNRERTNAWFAAHLQLMADSGLTLDHIKQVVQNPEYFSPRGGLIEFLEYLNSQSIPLIIITSGITNFIEVYFDFLGIDRSNIIILGNELFFDEEGNCTDYNKETVFCPLDDRSVFQEKLFIEDDNRVLLLGDKKEDLAMYDNSYKSIGFCKEDFGYDIELGKNGDLREIMNFIEKEAQIKATITS